MDSATREPTGFVKCYQCKHWGKRTSDYESDFLCYCLHPKIDKDSADSASVVDGEPGNGGVIATGANFGCIHGELR